MGYALDDAVLKESGDVARSRRLRAFERIHHLLRLELIGQLAIAFIVAGSSAAHHNLLVLIGEVVVGHFAKEELLTLVLDFHCQTAEPLVGVIHRQRLTFLPLIPMAHQNERERHPYTIIRYTLQEQAVGLVIVELRNLQVRGLPILGLVVQGFDGDFPFDLIQTISPSPE